MDEEAQKFLDDIKALFKASYWWNSIEEISPRAAAEVGLEYAFWTLWAKTGSLS